MWTLLRVASCSSIIVLLPDECAAGIAPAVQGPPARAVHDYGFPVCYDAEQPMGMAFAIEYLPTTIVVDRLLGKLIA